VNEPADPSPGSDPGPRPRRSTEVDRDYLRNRLHQRGHAMRYRWDPDNPGGRRATAPVDANLRASDAERNEVADRLSRHFADGRLDQAEFKERLDRAMGATTRGDLHGLFDDLPRLHSDAPPAVSRRRRLVPLMLIVAFVVLAAGTSISFGRGPFVHGPNLTWLLLVAAGLYVWARSGRRHHHRQQHGYHDHPAVEN
jgi:Domain of unknown function (DUF1707)